MIYLYKQFFFITASIEFSICHPCHAAFQGVEVVFHTAAADPDINDFQLHYKVNVEGMKNH
jgi:sterol-4alpha-carboxylate 3-dehydrogenase (decarboxylating)